MSNIENLENILKNELIPELDENLVELANLTQSWKCTQEDKEEFEDMKEMKKYFDDVLFDIQNNKLTQNDASDILEVLEDMRLDKE